MRGLTATVAVLLCALSQTATAERTVTLAATTSTANSGLLDHLLATFRDDTGIDMRVLTAGTGQALRYAERGDADVLLVHHRASEEAFIARGYGSARFDVMYNHFLLVGPPGDPAGIAGGSDAARAFAAIARNASPFVSRGDESGTHKRELALWREAGIDIGAVRESWYREMGAGQGATLSVASQMRAYCLTDRATWLATGNRSGLRLLVEDQRRLLNQYSVVLVNPELHRHTRAAEARALVDWLLSPRGQGAIDAFIIGGEQAFFANAASR